jgi:hypothetical protein
MSGFFHHIPGGAMRVSGPIGRILGPLSMALY